MSALLDDLHQEDAYALYERRRRERLLRVMLPLTASVVSLGIVAYTILLLFQPPIDQAWAFYGMLLGLAVLCWVGTFTFWRGQLEVATTLMIVAGGVGFPLVVVVRGIIQGIDALTIVQFMIFGVVLVLVGMLGNRLTIVLATLVLNIATILLVAFSKPEAGLEIAWQHELKYPVIATTLVFEWFFAAFILAQWSAYQQTLRDLGTAFERAQQLEILKDRFITHVNHELRTPIMTMDGYIEILHAARARMSDDEQETAIQQANKTGKMISALLESILDVRRIDDSAVLDPQIVSVAQALDAAQALLGPSEDDQESHRIQRTLEPSLAIWGEPVRLQQILTNLLSNAIKYSPAGSPIEVTAQHLPAEAPPLFLRRLAPASAPARASVEIRVRDYGLGVPPAQIPLLFHRFVRLPRDLGSKVPGNGLGLYLCRVYAEAMGGSMRLESTGKAGEGSTFILRLPEAVEADMDPTQPRRATTATVAATTAPRRNKTKQKVPTSAVR